MKFSANSTKHTANHFRQSIPAWPLFAPDLHVSTTTVFIYDVTHFSSPVTIRVGHYNRKSFIQPFKENKSLRNAERIVVFELGAQEKDIR